MHGLIHWLAGAFAHFLLGSLTVWVYVLTNRGGWARRSPASAVGWVLGLFQLPDVVLPLYALYGRRKLRHGADARWYAVPADADWSLRLGAALGNDAGERAGAVRCGWFG